MKKITILLFTILSVFIVSTTSFATPMQKVTICHVTGSGSVTISVSPSAVAAHLSQHSSDDGIYSDQVGPCES